MNRFRLLSLALAGLLVRAEVALGQPTAQEVLTEIWEGLAAFLPNLIGALLILIAGWVVAWVAGALVRRGFRALKIDERLSRQGVARQVDVDALAGRLTYYFILLFAVMAFLATLQLEVVTQPLNQLLGEVTQYLPRLVGAGVILLVAYLVALVLRSAVAQVLGSTKFEERLGQRLGPPAAPETAVSPPVSISQTIGNVVFWLVLLFALPAVLGTLQLQAITAPLEQMMTEVLASLPNVAAASIIVLVGWFLAKVVSEIASNLLIAAGLDQGAERWGLQQVVAGRSPSRVIGTILYAVVLIPALIAALGALQIRAITEPAQQMLGTFLNALPVLFAAAVILVLGYVLGRVLAGLATTILPGLGFDALPAKLGLSPLSPGARTPSQIAGTLVLLSILVLALMQAAEVLQFAALKLLITDFVAFAAKVVFAVIILGAGLYLANLARGMVRAAWPEPAWAGAAVYAAVVVLATAIALDWVGLSRTVIAIVIGAPLAAAAVAVAIAFGVGGQQIAARQLAAWFARKD